jgi:hypothetical protein
MHARADARFRAWLDRTQVSAKLKPANIFLLSLVEANPPNLISVKINFPAIHHVQYILCHNNIIIAIIVKE